MRTAPLDTISNDTGSSDRPAFKPLLLVEDLRCGFHTGQGLIHAVDGVSFSLERGRALGLVGESGSGKTVLARSIMGLLPRSGVTKSGQVNLDGQDISQLSPRQLRHLWGAQLAMIFQDPMTALNPVVRIGRQITEHMRTHLGIGRAEARSAAVALLESVGIPEPDRRLSSYPHQLSGGTRQRVMIAIALACGPKLLLADEPTTGLDVTVQAQVLDLLAAQQARRSMGLILVTHDLAVVAGRAEETAVMYAGKIVEKGPTSVLFHHPLMPYTEALLRAIPRLDLPSHTRLGAIPGRPPDLSALPPGCRFAPRCPYAQDRCRTQEPPLEEAGAGHFFACWYPRKGSLPASWSYTDSVTDLPRAPTSVTSSQAAIPEGQIQ